MMSTYQKTIELVYPKDFFGSTVSILKRAGSSSFENWLSDISQMTCDKSDQILDIFPDSLQIFIFNCVNS